MSQILMRTFSTALSSRPCIYRYLTTYTNHQPLDHGEQATGPRAGSDKQDDGNKASLEQLTELENYLERMWPKFFASQHPLQIYTSDVIFQNNIANYKTKGIGMYAANIALIKLYFSTRNSGSTMELFNLVKIPEESCIKARWRVNSHPPLYKVFVSPVGWRSRKREISIDGISILHVNNKGLIHCHVCDNIDIYTEDENLRVKSLKEKLMRQGLSV